jgi:hypothetical protein
MSRRFAPLVLLIGLVIGLNVVQVVDANGIRGENTRKSTLQNEAAAARMTRKRRSLQNDDEGCPCDCTDSLDNGEQQDEEQEAFLIQGPLGNAVCVPAAAGVVILDAFQAIKCAPADEEGGGCTEDFIVLPIPGGGDEGGGGLLPFDDSLQFDDALGGLLDDALALDDVLAFDDTFGLGDLLPFAAAP